MCKDPEIRDSKRSSGNKARTFNIEGKAHHLGHGTKKDLSLLKCHHGICLAGQTHSRGPAESVRGDNGPKALCARVRSLQSS